MSTGEDQARPNPVTVRLTAGVAVPDLPLRDLVRAFSLYLEHLPGGTWTPGESTLRLIASVRVSPGNVTVRAHTEGFTLQGRPLTPEVVVEVPIGGVVAAGESVWTHRAARGGLYRSVLVGTGVDDEVHLSAGQSVELGREPNPPGLVLPQRKHVVMEFCPSEAAMRAEAAGFTVDTGLVSRRQATLSMSDDGILSVTQLSERVPTWRLREGVVEKVEPTLPLRQGDQLLVGTVILDVG